MLGGNNWNLDPASTWSTDYKMEVGLGKKKRRSKKSKKSWRKFTDVNDIEEFLEDQRKDERTGGPASEKADKELYFVAKDVESVNGVQLRRKQRLHKLNNLRCEANLHPSTVNTPFSRKRTKPSTVKGAKKRRLGSNVSDSLGKVIDSSDEEYEYDNRYSRMRREEKAAMAAIVEKRVRNPKVYSAMRDLWGESLDPKDIPDDHYLRVTRKKSVKKPNSMSTKPSLLRSVEPPPPGASYNPTFEDHQDLLQSAVIIEEQKLKAAEKVEKRLKLTPMDHRQRERVWLEEMTAGLFDSGSEEERGVARRPVRAEDRKLRKERRKERERREQERLEAEVKAERMRMADVYRLKTIKKDIARREMVVAEKTRKRMELEKEGPYQTRRLGRQVYQEPDIDVQLSSEVPGSLRSLKPEGSIAMDRFKSFQKRNIIEPRKAVKPFRKYKLKEKEKRSARLPEEDPFN